MPFLFVRRFYAAKTCLPWRIFVPKGGKRRNFKQRGFSHMYLKINKIKNHRRQFYQISSTNSKSHVSPKCQRAPGAGPTRMLGAVPACYLPKFLRLLVTGQGRHLSPFDPFNFAKTCPLWRIFVPKGGKRMNCKQPIFGYI